MNTTYRKNLKDVAIACKNYVDTMFNNFRWELGAYDIDLSTDSNVAYVKSVPSTAIGCEINTLGGMSYKSINLIDTSNLFDIYIDGSGNEVASTTDKTTDYIFVESGVTQVSMSILALTTAPSIAFRVAEYNSNKTFITRQLLYNDIVQGKISSKTFTLNANTKYIRFIFNTSYYGDINTWMGNYGTVKAYQPYYTGIRDSAVTQFTIEGNLFDKTNVIARTYINSNGSLGTESQDGWYTTQPIEIFNAVTFNFNTVQARWRLLDNSQNYISNTYNSTVNASETITNTVNAKYVQICFRMNDLDTFMVVNGSTAPSVFKPYIAPTTKSIPAQIQALDGYGWGINNTCYNYIDFENKKFVQKVGRVDLGSLTYTLSNSIFRSTSALTGAKGSLNDGFVGLIANDYVLVGSDEIQSYDGAIAIGPSSKTGFIKDTSYSDATAFKNAMSGVYLYYELETPIETDVSQYLTDDDKYIDVEPSGTITFDNTYSQDVPSDIDYLIEEVKA